MKFKKIKQLRKWINFYRINYDFHFPYKLLVDGTFLKACYDRKFEFKEKLTKLMHGQCWVQITTCVLNELRSIPQLKDLFDFAMSLPKLRCNHIDGLTPTECFKDLVQKNNTERYWVMTQDEELREYFNQFYPIPLFWISKDLKFTIEEPNKKCQKEIEKKKHNKYLPSEKELAVIKQVQKEQKEEQLKKYFQKIDKIKNEMNIRVKKPARGPNPLSVQKKKEKIIQKNKDQTKTRNRKTKKIRKRENHLRTKKVVKSNESE
ncbi:hypothetical protein ABPG74_019392 [Tetrahymena malaccensis]